MIVAVSEIISFATSMLCNTYILLLNPLRRKFQGHFSSFYDVWYTQSYTYLPLLNPLRRKFQGPYSSLYTAKYTQSYTYIPLLNPTEKKISRTLLWFLLPSKIIMLYMHACVKVCSSVPLFEMFYIPLLF